MSRRRQPPLHEVFFALSDPTRLEVVRLLGSRSRRASDLAEDLGTSRPGMSRHLRILRAAQVVREEPDPEDGRARTLVLDERAFSDMRRLLEEVSSRWDERLEAFKALAEERAQQGKLERKTRRRAS